MDNPSGAAPSLTVGTIKTRVGAEGFGTLTGRMGLVVNYQCGTTRGAAESIEKKQIKGSATRRNAVCVTQAVAVQVANVTGVADGQCYASPDESISEARARA